MRAFLSLIGFILVTIAVLYLVHGMGNEMRRQHEMERTPLLIDKEPLK